MQTQSPPGVTDAGPSAAALPVSYEPLARAGRATGFMICESVELIANLPVEHQQSYWDEQRAEVPVPTVPISADHFARAREAIAADPALASVLLDTDAVLVEALLVAADELRLTWNLARPTALPTTYGRPVQIPPGPGEEYASTKLDEHGEVVMEAIDPHEARSYEAARTVHVLVDPIAGKVLRLEPSAQPHLCPVPAWLAELQLAQPAED